MDQSDGRASIPFLFVPFRFLFTNVSILIVAVSILICRFDSYAFLFRFCSLAFRFLFIVSALIWCRFGSYHHFGPGWAVSSVSQCASQLTSQVAR